MINLEHTGKWKSQETRQIIYWKVHLGRETLITHFTWTNKRFLKVLTYYKEATSKCIWVLDHIWERHLISAMFSLHQIKITNVTLVSQETIEHHRCPVSRLWPTITKILWQIIGKWLMIRYLKVQWELMPIYRWTNRLWVRWCQVVK